MTVVCGVDGCRAGWVAVYYDVNTGRIWSTVVTALSAVLDGSPPPQVVAVDVPIGLLSSGSRVCDKEARRLLGVRGSSVFPAPIRPVLLSDSYETACAARRAVEQLGISRQAWGITPKIKEVDDLLRSDPSRRSLVREVHPEVCFYFLNDQKPMRHSKKKPAGRHERRELLSRVFGGAIDSVLEGRKPKECGEDDVLDAFAALWTAGRIHARLAVVIPPLPPRDQFDLPMEMVA